MSTEFIALLPPPGPTLDLYDPELPSTSQDASIPPTFSEAMSIREAVFVHEQSFPLNHEFDSDDARSFHWVVYASVSSTTRTAADGRRSSEGSRVPVGTIRLVPPPHEAPHPNMGSETRPSAAGSPGNAEGTTSAPFHDGKESYVKLTRLAVLKPYRRLGLARLLMHTALEWAGKHPEQVMPEVDPTAREARKMATGEAEHDERWSGLVLVHAQVGVEKMWAGHGFVRDREMGVWDEDGVEHIGMWKRVPVRKI